MVKKLSSKMKYLLQLGRYNYPTGGFLLMWPCFWGVFYELNYSTEIIKILILFFIGSFVMRGAGCCINDLLDKDIDKKVSRTRKRPLVTKKLSDTDVIWFLIFQLIIGLFVVLNFEEKTIIFSFSIIPLIFIYPLFKRFTNFPQLFLGIVFNWGIIIGFLTQNNSLNLGIFFLYLSGIFFTICYDTIYAFQDIKDDKKAGVKSLAIFLENKPNLIIFMIYLLSFFFFVLSIIYLNQRFWNSLLISTTILICYSLQYLAFIKKKSLKTIFDSSNLVGAIISTILYLQNYL
jgi:4-hydroxybenzoate polyprenyltransferase